MRSNNKTIRTLCSYIGKYSFFIVSSLLCSVVYVAASLYIPIICGDAIDLMIGEGAVDMAGVTRYAVTIGITALLGGLFFYLMTLCNNKIIYSTVRDIRRDAMHTLLRVSISYTDSHKSGEIVSRIINDTDKMADGLLLGFSNLFVGVVTIIGTLIFMFSVNLPITLIVVVCTPVSIFTARFIANRIHSLFEKQAKTQGIQTAYIDEAVTNRKTVISTGNYEKVCGRFDNINEELRNHSKNAIFYSSLTNPITRFVNSLVYMGVGLGGALLCLTDPGFTVGMLSVFLSYANKYTKPFNEISEVIPELQNASVCAARVFELAALKTEEENTENDGAVFDGSMTFDEVSFSYTPEKPLIKNFNLSAKSGMKIAIVGPTGCGKTTLINLIMRFYDPISGRILAGGTDTSTMSRSYLRKHIGMVLQDTIILEGTVREVISYGRPDATLEEVENAAKLAHAHSFITKLPQGYDTVISGDNSISYGQRQLLCIARIMLILPPMLILDEATSSIDVLTESKIRKAFDELTEGRTSFIVAHRLSTIKESDLILVMKDGNIIEQGTHEALLEKKGFYSELWEAGL
ncbi:MAG: ABC transporter ATP-binding protein [Ruminococcaceae bacterium]|nr:ABC transporter ATP-binding protein [Oscillospiraceae bacterium]